jgi:hypothetical protein
VKKKPMALSSAFTLSNSLPAGFVDLVRTPRALLSHENRRRVDIFEAMLRFDVFTKRARDWSRACAFPPIFDLRWRRCPTCSRVLMVRETISDSCTRCHTVGTITLSLMWGDQ